MINEFEACFPVIQPEDGELRCGNEVCSRLLPPGAPYGNSVESIGECYDGTPIETVILVCVYCSLGIEPG